MLRLSSNLLNFKMNFVIELTKNRISPKNTDKFVIFDCYSGKNKNCDYI